MAGHKLIRSKAPPRLAGIVDAIAVYQEAGQGPVDMFEVASLVVPLVIGFSSPFSIGFGRLPRAGDEHVSFVGGMAACPVEIHSPGNAHCLQINFTPPGARAFFNVPLVEITNRLVDPEALLGRQFTTLRQMLADEADWQRRISIAEDFVTRRLLKTAPANAEAGFAYRQIVASGGTVPVQRLAAELGRSRKHLRTIMRDACGLAPKAIASIARLEQARSLAAGGVPLSMVAAECGYADQAHMTREFRRLAGRTPAALIGGA